MSLSFQTSASAKRDPAFGRYAWLLALVLVAGTLVRIALHPWAAEPWSGNYVGKRLVADGWKIILFVALPLAPVLILEGRSIGRPTGLPPPSRPVAALTLAVLWIFVVAAVDRWLGRSYAFWPAAMPWPHVALGTVSTFLAALSEEFAFRGLLLPRLVARCGWFRGQVAAAAVFGLVHLPGWTILNGAHPLVASSLAAQVALFGGVLGLVTLWAGRLAPAIALHFLNNLASGPAFR